MRKRVTKNKHLKIADQASELLLYELYGNNIAKKPEFPIPTNDATFSEKKGLYAELLKRAQIELKISENGEEVSGLDLIRRELNGSGTGRGRGNHGRTQGSPDESDGDSPEEAADA